MSSRVYSDPEFLRSIHVIPFDAEADYERERRLQHQASYMFAREQERLASVRFCRAVLGCIGFVVVCGLAFYEAARWVGFIQ